MSSSALDGRPLSIGQIAQREHQNAVQEESYGASGSKLRFASTHKCENTYALLKSHEQADFVTLIVCSLLSEEELTDFLEMPISVIFKRLNIGTTSNPIEHNSIAPDSPLSVPKASRASIKTETLSLKPHTCR